MHAVFLSLKFTVGGSRKLRKYFFQILTNVVEEATAATRTQTVQTQLVLTSVFAMKISSGTDIHALVS